MIPMQQEEEILTLVFRLRILGEYMQCQGMSTEVIRKLVIFRFKKRVEFAYRSLTNVIASSTLSTGMRGMIGPNNSLWI
jgi:hypothetical protein